MSEIAGKLLNALGGFWDSLDDQERRLLLVYGAYLAGCVAISYQRGARERFRAQLLEEVHHAREARV